MQPGQAGAQSKKSALLIIRRNRFPDLQWEDVWRVQPVPISNSMAKWTLRAGWAFDQKPYRQPISVRHGYPVMTGPGFQPSRLSVKRQ